MVGGVEMPGGMFVLRRVAAADVTAAAAETQVHPGIPHRQALLAAVGAGSDVLYLINMGAIGGHGVLLAQGGYSVFGVRTDSTDPTDPKTEQPNTERRRLMRPA